MASCQADEYLFRPEIFGFFKVSFTLYNVCMKIRQYMFFHKVSTQLIKKTFFPFHFVVYLSKEVSVSISRASKKVFIQFCMQGKNLPEVDLQENSTYIYIYFAGLQLWITKQCFPQTDGQTCHLSKINITTTHLQNRAFAPKFKFHRFGQAHQLQDYEQIIEILEVCS